MYLRDNIYIRNTRNAYKVIYLMKLYVNQNSFKESLYVYRQRDKVRVSRQVRLG